jgi:hypothetical protein
VEIPTNKILENLRGKSVKKGLYPQKHLKIKNNIKKTRSPFEKEPKIKK